MKDQAYVILEKLEKLAELNVELTPMVGILRSLGETEKRFPIKDSIIWAESSVTDLLDRIESIKEAYRRDLDHINNIREQVIDAIKATNTSGG